MTAIWIIAAVVVAICLLLIAPLKAEVILRDEISVTVIYLVLKFKFPNVSPKQGQRPDTPKEHNAQKSAQLGYIKKLIDKKGFAGAVYELLDILQLLFKKFMRLLSHIIVKNFNLKIRVGSDDAAVTALEYGAVCAVVYPTLGLAESLLKFKKQKTDISCDYNSENSVLEMDATLKIRLIFLIMAGISLVLSYIKYAIGNNNKKDGVTNE